MTTSLPEEMKIQSPTFNDKAYFDYLLSLESVDDDTSYFPEDSLSDVPVWTESNYNKPSFIENLHLEILDFVHYCKPTPLESLMRLHLIEKLESLCQDVFTGSSIRAFGSGYTGLFLPGADVDLVVKAHDYSTDSAVSLLADVMIQAGYSHVQPITGAKIPIVKAIDPITKLKIDISFNISSGITSTRYLCDLVQEFPISADLFLVLKRFLLQRGLNDTYSGGLGSYPLFLSIIGFLQNYSYCFGYSKCLPSNLGRALLDYFDFYLFKFNWRNLGLSIQDNGRVFFKDRCGLDAPQDCLCIEDPTDSSNNVGKGSRNFFKIMRAYEYAYKQLVSISRSRDYHCATPLSSILWFSLSDRVERIRSVSGFIINNKGIDFPNLVKLIPQFPVDRAREGPIQSAKTTKGGKSGMKKRRN
ncbi:hypothetical protein GEMRC1_014052 [Eukaryota sp. GEM-RC1]